MIFMKFLPKTLIFIKRKNSGGDSIELHGPYVEGHGLPVEKHCSRLIREGEAKVSHLFYLPSSGLILLIQYI